MVGLNMAQAITHCNNMFSQEERHVSLRAGNYVSSFKKLHDRLEYLSPYFHISPPPQFCKIMCLNFIAPS